MAAMPSVGRTKQLLAVAVAATFLGVTASSASAADVWMWACHGPGQDAPVDRYAESRGQRPSGDGRDQRQLQRRQRPEAGVLASRPGRVEPAPSCGSRRAQGVSVKQIRVMRRTNGFGGAEQAGNRQRYTLTFDGDVVEERALDSGPRDDLTAVQDFPPTPRPARSPFELTCADACPLPPAARSRVDIVGVAFLVSDANAPTGGAGGNSPVNKVMRMYPNVDDPVGVGLDRVEVTILKPRIGGAAQARARSSSRSGTARSSRPAMPRSTGRSTRSAACSRSRPPLPTTDPTLQGRSRRLPLPRGRRHLGPRRGNRRRAVPAPSDDL